MSTGLWFLWSAGVAIETGRNLLHVRWHARGVALGLHRASPGYRAGWESASVVFLTAIYALIAAAVLIVAARLNQTILTIAIVAVLLRAGADVVHGINCILEMRNMDEAARLAAEHQAHRGQVEHQ
jgi:hypothetical protein